MAGTAHREPAVARAARPAPALLHRLSLARGGASVALDVAAAQLSALGCPAATGVTQGTGGAIGTTGTTGMTAATDVGAHGGGSAGYLELHRAGCGTPAVRCDIDWAGPVSLPIRDEAGAQAACGIMHVHGRRSGAPAALGVDYASATAGVLAAQGVLAALLARWRGMDVRRVSTSVAGAALLSVSQYLAAATSTDDWTEPLQPGGPPFTSADGVRFEIEALHAERWWRFWAALGAAPEPVRRGWLPFQQRFATATCPLPAELFGAAAARDWTATCAAAVAAGVSIVAVQQHGRRSEPALPPWRITPLGGAAPTGPAPGPKQLGALPLSGLVVVESTRRVQGPLAGHLLRMLGARVIRVEPPDGDPLRGVPPMAGDCSARFLALNHSKTAVRLDLGSAPGRRALRELVATADVFLHNWAPGKAAQWDLDAERLAAVRPGLVYAWASGWGDALGPAPPLGTDYLVQAYSGLAARLVPDGAAPAPSLMTLTDVLGGAVCAQGVLAGLLARAATGRGQRVDSSLLSAATLLAALDSANRPGARTPARARDVPVCTDLAELAADPRFALALSPLTAHSGTGGRRGATTARPPWEFT